MCAVVLVHRIPGHQRVEVRRLAALGPEDATETLGLLLSAAEGPGDLDGNVRVGQVDGEVGHLGDDQQLDLAPAEGGVESPPLPIGGLPRDDGRLEPLADFLELIQVLSDHQDVAVFVPLQQGADAIQFGGVGGGQAVLIPALGQGVGHFLVLFQLQPHLGANGLGDPALLFQHPPGYVVALGSDEGEHIVFASVFPHQGGGEPQPALGLNLRRDAEHRRRQQMHLVVDDEAPVLPTKQVQVGKRFQVVFVLRLARRLQRSFAWPGLPASPFTVGQHLVGGDGDGRDFLPLTRVLADEVFGQVRLIQEFLFPLTGGHNAGHHDERLHLGAGDQVDPDDGLAGAAWQHQHTAPAGRGAAHPVGVRCILLIFAHHKRFTAASGLPQVDLHQGAGGISRQVLRRPAQLDERLLQASPVEEGHLDATGV